MNPRSGVDQPRESDDRLNGPGRGLRFDISFVESPGGFEIWYSDRCPAATRSWSINLPTGWRSLGVLNLGPDRFNVLIADGPTDR